MKYFIFSLLTVSLLACGAPQDPEDIGDRQYPGDQAENLDAPTPPIDEVLTTTQSEDPQSANLKLNPIYHGSLVIEYGDQTIFVDPHGGAERYKDYPSPDLVLITHTHGDHLDKETLGGLHLETAVLTGPPSVIESFEDDQFAAQNTVTNGEETAFGSIGITAVPAYNLPSSGKEFHPRGKFNGYVLSFDNYRVYVAGDTGPINEMKALENIDYAFVPMNQPYTMTVAQAAEAVAAFQPKVVYPYHYRNQDKSLSDIDEFERILKEMAPDVQVRRADWYPELGK